MNRETEEDDDELDGIQHELTEPGPLLDETGQLEQVGWARQPLLDCNLEQARFYPLRFLQRFRIKRWDYYGITTPQHFYSFTLADLGYAGMVFAYAIDLTSGDYHEETLTLPPGRDVVLPRNSADGISLYNGERAHLMFATRAGERRLAVTWPDFGGRSLRAEVQLRLPPEHESMTIVIPIRGKRFYYNRKVNCMPATGWVAVGDSREELNPDTCLGNLDWGRGVWEYNSFWLWASASGFLPGGRRVGLNLGYGFGDNSAATENALILDGRIHKLGHVEFKYDTRYFLLPWEMRSPDGRVDLEFAPFKERVARTNMAVLASEVHQLFGRYHGRVFADDGETVELDGQIGFAEEHHARW